jgi:hypothetical protein
MAVSRLITLFESLDSRTASKSRRSPRSASSRHLQPSLPFSEFDLSLDINDFRSETHTRMISTPSTSIPSPSVASSPSSSFRSSNHYPYSPFSLPSSRYLLRRQPSAVDIALQEERNTAGPIGLGLTLMEPRPVLEVPVSVGTSCVFDGTEREEEKQPFFMGGIIEVMEGTC